MVLGGDMLFGQVGGVGSKVNVVPKQVEMKGVRLKGSFLKAQR